MKLLGRSLLIAATAACATQGFADIVKIFSRATLPIKMTPRNIAPDMVSPNPEWFAQIDGVQTNAQLHLGNINNNFVGCMGEQQRSADGDHGAWEGNFAHDSLLAVVDANVDSAAFYWVPQGQLTPHVLISGFGTQIQCDTAGPFTAQIRAYDQTALKWTPWFTFNGNSTNAGDNSALFIGVQSNARNISAIQIRARSAGKIATGHWAINSPSISISTSPTVNVGDQPN